MTKAENDLKAMINGVQKNLDDAVKDLNDTIAGNKADIEEKLQKVEEEYKAADALMKLDIEALIAKDTEFEAKIKALEESCSSANAELRAAIDKVQKNLDDANRRLDEKDAELETKLNILRADSDKNSLICLIVNIVLGIAVLVLLALYIVVATKKKSQK